MPDDELAAVRCIRREIIEDCGADLDRVLDFYEEAQKRIMESGRYTFVSQPIQKAMPTGETHHVSPQH
jgi:hypothetical protein